VLSPETLTLSGVLLTAVGSLWVKLNKKESQTDSRVSKIETALFNCEEKHEKSNIEIGNLKQLVGELTGKLSIYERFSPETMITAITKGVKELLDQ
jgi:hypothetical protein